MGSQSYLILDLLCIHFYEAILSTSNRKVLVVTVKCSFAIILLPNSVTLAIHITIPLAKPLQDHGHPWQGIIIDLLQYGPFHFVLVVVDRLTKMVRFVPCNNTIIG